MEYTTNYQLNQWDAQDAIKRTDFNEDNAKVDAALARVEGMASTAPVLLATAQLESEAHALTMDVSHLDLSQYDELRLVVSCNSAGTAGTQLLCMQVNGISTDMQYCYYDGGSSSSIGNYMVVGYCGSQASTDSLTNITLYHTSRLAVIAQSVQCSSANVTGSQHWGSASFCSFDTLDSFTILCGTGGANFATGSKMFVLGHKY